MAIFGHYDAADASFSNPSGAYKGSFWTPASSGVLVSARCLMYNLTANEVCRVSLYEWDAVNSQPFPDLVAESDEKTLPVGIAKVQVDFVFSGGESVTAGTTYYVDCWAESGSANTRLYYTTTGLDNGWETNYPYALHGTHQADPIPAATLAAGGLTDHEQDIEITYTPSGGIPQRLKVGVGL